MCLSLKIIYCIDETARRLYLRTSFEVQVNYVIRNVRIVYILFLHIAVCVIGSELKAK